MKVLVTSKRIDYSYRIIFQIKGEEVHLLNIGSHDEVY